MTRVAAWSESHGACEDKANTVTHGAVLYSPESMQALVFGDKISEDWISRWTGQGRKQLICQAGLPVLVANLTWRSIISERSILWFIDNNSSLAAIIHS